MTNEIEKNAMARTPSAGHTMRQWRMAVCAASIASAISRLFLSCGSQEQQACHVVPVQNGIRDDAHIVACGYACNCVHRKQLMLGQQARMLTVAPPDTTGSASGAFVQDQQEPHDGFGLEFGSALRVRVRVRVRGRVGVRGIRTVRHHGLGIELREAGPLRPVAQAPHEAPLGVGADRPRGPVRGVLRRGIGG